MRKIILLTLLVVTLCGVTLCEDEKCYYECKTCSDYYTCTSCNVGYYLTYSSCYACPTGCYSCTRGDYCDNCKPEYEATEDHLYCVAKRDLTGPIVFFSISAFFLGICLFICVRAALSAQKAQKQGAYTQTQPQVPRAYLGAHQPVNTSPFTPGYTHQPYTAPQPILPISPNAIAQHPTNFQNGI